MVKGLFSMFSDSAFWNQWADRFNENYPKYVTPNNKKVVEAVEELPVDIYSSDKEKVIAVWRGIRDRVDYKLSKKWKTPEETLEDGIGDCEDVTFLATSMFLRLDLTSEIRVGDLIDKEDGSRELHTWNVSNGIRLDATGDPEDTKKFNYKIVKSFKFSPHRRE